jgi:DNA-binding MarR family transcriptional regulator
MSTRVSDRTYERELRLAALFRTELRRFLRRTKTVTAEAGLTPERYDLLLAIRALAGAGQDVRLTDLCEALQLRQTAVSELVKRAEAAGLVEKAPAAGDRRAVSLQLTVAGESRLRQAFEALRADRLALRAAFAEAEARLDELTPGGRL